MGNLKLRLDITWVGLCIGLIGPSLLFTLYHLLKYGHMGVDKFVEYLTLEGTFSPRISLCVILNLGLFFTFYWLKMDRAAKGIIAATFVYAGLIIYLKLIA